MRVDRVMCFVIVILIIATSLFVAHRQRWISDRTFTGLVGVAAVIAMFAAMAVFFVPVAPQPTTVGEPTREAQQRADQARREADEARLTNERAKQAQRDEENRRTEYHIAPNDGQIGKARQEARVAQQRADQARREADEARLANERARQVQRDEANWRARVEQRREISSPVTVGFAPGHLMQPCGCWGPNSTPFVQEPRCTSGSVVRVTQCTRTATCPGYLPYAYICSGG